MIKYNKKIKYCHLTHLFSFIMYHVNSTKRKGTTAQESEAIKRSFRYWLLGHTKTDFNQLYASPCCYV